MGTSSPLRKQALRCVRPGKHSPNAGIAPHLDVRPEIAELEKAEWHSWCVCGRYRKGKQETTPQLRCVLECKLERPAHFTGTLSSPSLLPSAALGDAFYHLADGCSCDGGICCSSFTF